ncbi:MAG: hypothetical protein AAFO82_17345, partial [Bacteroidota bacterium]
MNIRIDYIPVFFLLCFSSFSTAQSLYQDALSLSEIIKNEAQGSSGQFTSNPPKLVAMKERKGIHYFFAKNPIDYYGEDLYLEPVKKYVVAGASPDAQLLFEQEGKRIAGYQFQEALSEFTVIRNLGRGNIVLNNLQGESHLERV